MDDSTDEIQQLIRFMLACTQSNDFDAHWAHFAEAVSIYGFSFLAYGYSTKPVDDCYFLLHSACQPISREALEQFDWITCFDKPQIHHTSSPVVCPDDTQHSLSLAFSADLNCKLLAHQGDFSSERIDLLCQYGQHFHQTARNFPIYQHLHCRYAEGELKFTDKELATIKWLAQGHSIKQVAILVSRSVDSINKYIRQLKNKLKARSRTDLIRTASHLGLI